jgi:hypothetical protein
MVRYMYGARSRAHKQHTPAVILITYLSRRKSLLSLLPPGLRQVLLRTCEKYEKPLIRYQACSRRVHAVHNRWLVCPHGQCSRSLNPPRTNSLTCVVSLLVSSLSLSLSHMSRSYNTPPRAIPPLHLPRDSFRGPAPPHHGPRKGPPPPLHPPPPPFLPHLRDEPRVGRGM